MTDRLDFEIDVELETGLITGHAGAPGLIEHRDPEILGGTPVFRGTRVPIRSLFDYLEGGDTLDEFLRQFPSVQREQAIALLDLARQALAADAPAA